MRQLTPATAGFDKHSKLTARAAFLAEMEQVVPWRELCAVVEPFYPKPGNGRPPIGLDRMLRLHFLQQERHRTNPVSRLLAEIPGVGPITAITVAFMVLACRNVRSCSTRSSVPQLEPFFAKLEPTEVALEACAGSHHWGRVLSRLGHRVKLIAPQYVKPFVKRSKNDRNDTEAIGEAAIVAACSATVFSGTVRIVGRDAREVILDRDDVTNEAIVGIHWSGGRHTELRVSRGRTGRYPHRPSPEPSRSVGIDRYNQVSHSRTHVATG